MAGIWTHELYLQGRALYPLETDTLPKKFLDVATRFVYLALLREGTVQSFIVARIYNILNGK